MFDFDPRDHDSRDDERLGLDRHRSGRDNIDAAEVTPNGRQTDLRDRDDDARELGRGPGDSRPSVQGSRDDARWPERERSYDPRDVFTRDLGLPRGLEREIVRHRDHEYTLRGSETMALATVGAFRVVSSRDLRDHHDRPLDPRSSDLRNLREQGLVETVRLPGSREYAVALTREGRGLLEHHRDRDQGDRQTFWTGVKRERELEHDLQVYCAYERAAERLLERDAWLERVVLDHELKREYQSWLHERDRDRDDYDGHPDRTADEIREWAHEHDLPYFDDEVHFPDLRIEYQDRDGWEDHQDIEVVTSHYRGAHAASVARSGFTCYGGVSLRITAHSGSRGGGGRHRGPIEELFD
jgi:hypothetical protein